ncbi:MAG: DUF1080 domain-containing protein [Verrucomicrobiales bacterium]
MKRLPIQAALCVAASLALLSCDSGSGSGSADPAGTPTEETEFVELFNGEDLEGWTPSGEHPDSFAVRDGVLVVKGGRSHLFYTGDVNGGTFRDFELKVRAKTMPDANSGVYFHTEYQEEGWPDKGYECQVNSTHKDPKKTGSLYGVRNIVVLEEGQEPPKGGEHEIREEAPSTDGEWFDYHVIVEGKRVVVKVNGETTVDYEEPESGPGIERSPGRRLSEGTFAIQAHDPDSEIHYERFAVKPL